MPASIIAPNKVKQALHTGQTVIGTMVVELRQPSVMQLLANAQYDFAIIDNEHGAFNIETIADLSRTAKYAGLTPFVRVPELAYGHIAQSLDGGAQGIMVPRIVSAAEARAAVQMMKYPPQGQRGNALSRGYTNFLSGSPAEAMAAVNRETMLIIQIETKEALAHIEEIVTVPGVDFALVGPNDLSIALGVPGQMESPVLHAAIETVIAACRRHGVYPALHINNLTLAAYWMKKGIRAISTYSEINLMMDRGLEVTSTLRGSL
jgi:2-dehydro-3-deoxyglucarate aldolase/4-hydroxy-2-oxoheptanedioate aldolase